MRRIADRLVESPDDRPVDRSVGGVAVFRRRTGPADAVARPPGTTERENAR